jgi:hypothetical protein
MSLPDVGLGGLSPRRGHGRGHDDELAPPYRGHRVVLGPQPGGPQEGATSGGHELEQAEGANVGDDAGATIRVDASQGHDELPDSDLQGERMTAGERLMVAARYWAVEAWSGIRAKVTSPGTVYHAQPESLAQHDERIKRHEWVPEGYEGKWLEPLGVAYHQTFGKFGMVTGYAWKWIWDTPLAFFPALTLVFITVILIRYT